MGPFLLRPVHREHEDAHPVQRRRQPPCFLGAARNPAHEFLRFHASAPVFRGGARGMEAPRDAGAGFPRGSAGDSLGRRTAPHRQHASRAIPFQVAHAGQGHRRAGGTWLGFWTVSPGPRPQLQHRSRSTSFGWPQTRHVQPRCAVAHCRAWRRPQANPMPHETRESANTIGTASMAGDGVRSRSELNSFLAPYPK